LSLSGKTGTELLLKIGKAIRNTYLKKIGYTDGRDHINGVYLYLRLLEEDAGAEGMSSFELGQIPAP